MDVRLPDGTVVKNVPDNITKAELTAKLQANGYDVAKLGAQPAADRDSGLTLSDLITGRRPTTVGGVAAEAVKGVARGASNTAAMIPQGIANILPAPVGQAMMAGVNALAAPSLSTVQANPQNNAERMAATGGEVAGAALAGGGLGGGVRQAVTNVVLPAAGAVVGEQLGGEAGKTIGALAVPATQLAAAGANAARNAVAQRVAPRMAQFRQVGTQPSVGQATEVNFLQGFENLLSKFPGGQGVFRKFAENQQKQLGAVTRTGASAEDAGRAIEKGVGNFVERTKAEWQKLDTAVAQKIPAGTSFAPVNTAKALDDLTGTVAGAENTTKALANPTLVKIRDNMAADLKASNGVMPFEAMRQLRTKIGSMLDDSLVSGVPQGELKRLYGALSKDIEAAAESAGAGKEFARQSTFYKARMERIENVLERVIGKTPEETFQRFMPKDAEQANKVRAVMRSLDPDQRKVVTDAIVTRLGKATPGNQDAMGEAFSPQTFLKNWNRLSNGAKAQIFSDPVLRRNMDAMAGITENIGSGARVFANPSGTAGATAPYGIGFLLGGAGAAAATGNLPTAVALSTTAGGVMVGAKIGAKMLTSPKVVEWLAKAPTIKPGDMVKHVARLGAIFNETREPGLKKELGDYLSSVSGPQTQQQ